jgi:hypothetical protein
LFTYEKYVFLEWLSKQTDIAQTYRKNHWRQLEMERRHIHLKFKRYYSCVTSFWYFTTHSCTSCTLSPLFDISLHRAVPHVHCHLFLIFHYTEVYLMYIVIAAVSYFSTLNSRNKRLFSSWLQDYKKEVTTYMKYTSV